MYDAILLVLLFAFLIIVAYLCAVYGHCNVCNNLGYIWDPNDEPTIFIKNNRVYSKQRINACSCPVGVRWKEKTLDVD